MKKLILAKSIFTFALMAVFFQNCSDVKFNKPGDNPAPENPSACNFSGYQITVQPNRSNYNLNENITFSAVGAFDDIIWVFYKDINNNGVVDSSDQDVSGVISLEQPVRSFSSYGNYIAKATVRKNSDGAGGFLCERDLFKGVSVNDPSVLNNCTTPWGATVLHNGTFNAFNLPNGSCTVSCQSKQFRCNNGQIQAVDGVSNIANFQNQSCTPVNPSTCVVTPTCTNPFTGATVSVGSSVIFAKTNSQCGGRPCLTQPRVCTLNAAGTSASFAGDTSYNQNPATCVASAACPGGVCNISFPVTVTLEARPNGFHSPATGTVTVTANSESQLRQAASNFYSHPQYWAPGSAARINLCNTTGACRYFQDVLVYRHEDGVDPWNSSQRCEHLNSGGAGPMDYYRVSN